MSNLQPFMKNQTGLLSYPFLEERIHHHIFRHRCQAPMAEVLLLWRRCCCCVGGGRCCGGGGWSCIGGGVRESVGGISARLVQRSLSLSYQARTHGPNHPGEA